MSVELLEEVIEEVKKLIDSHPELTYANSNGEFTETCGCNNRLCNKLDTYLKNKKRDLNANSKTNKE